MIDKSFTKNGFAFGTNIRKSGSQDNVKDVWKLLKKVFCLPVFMISITPLQQLESQITLYACSLSKYYLQMRIPAKTLLILGF